MRLMDEHEIANDLISKVSTASWKYELEKTSYKYHVLAAWAAIIFDPVFAATDYFNIPDSWQHLFVIRCTISAIVLTTLYTSKRKNWPSYYMVLLTFLLISLQNAYTYSLIGNEDLLGHNLNYMALLIGAAMFLAWEFKYSILVIAISAVATAYFLFRNETLDLTKFFIEGGLLLIAVAFFMGALIRTRYNLTVKEIKARLALQTSYEEIQAQDEEIKGINENLENIVRARTAELEKKNKALEEYAFINAHRLRSPVASILGLINLMNKVPLSDEAKGIMWHLQDSTEKLDDTVSTITKTIEKGEREEYRAKANDEEYDREMGS
jgi:signal transduction histidine kinase